MRPACVTVLPGLPGLPECRSPLPSPCMHAGGTRTCIHTPGEPMRPEELTPELAEQALAGAHARQ